MVGMVLKDFYARRREALKGSLFHAVMSVLYIAFICNPYATDMELTKRVIGTTQFILLFLMLLLHAMYPNNLTNTMFLVPIEEKDKKRYLYTAYGVKVAGITIIHVIYNSVLVCMGKMILWQAILLVSTLFWWSLVTGISHFKFGDSLPVAESQAMSGNAWRILWSYIISAFLFLALAFGEGIEKEWEIALIVLLVILQIFVCIWTLKKDFHFCIEEGINYEVVKKKNQKQRGKQHG